jgi:Tol biopolymer transport system component
VAARYVAISEPAGDLPVVEEAPAVEDVQVEDAPVEETTPAEDVSSAPGDAPSKPAAATTNAAGLSGRLVLQTSWGSDIYVYDLATGELRLLTGGFDPSISPDGTQVAFTRIGGEHGLYLINIDGSNERRIFGERNEFFSPKWSPDGQSILFMRTDSAYDCELCIPEELRRKFPWYRVRPRLARVDVNGQNYLDIASLDTATSPDWNSAGVVYSSDAGIQITTPTSLDENRRVIFDIQQQYYQDPDWQPNGGRIVYHQRRAGRWALFGINPDGSGRVELNPPPTALVDAMPSNVAGAWSPDGRHIVFLSNRGADNSAGAWGVWVMNADGGNVRRLPIDLPFEYNYVDEQMIDWGP